MIENDEIKDFVLRVYGIFINAKNQLLISDEYFLDTPMIKFPGGGLEPGEGIIDGLRREIREELNTEITNVTHYYTTDFFQKALFYTNRQLISFYYQAVLVDTPQCSASPIPVDFSKLKNGDQRLRWVDIDRFDPDQLTFPIDRIVGKRLYEEYAPNKM